MGKYLCPICGYPDLDEPAYNLLTGDPSFDICPCCGYEYGYGDPTTSASKEIFLRNWIRLGTPWSRPGLRPSNWDARIQLRGIDVDFDKLLE